MTSVWFDILVACNDSIYQYDMISVMIAYQCDITNEQVMISIIIWGGVLFLTQAWVLLKWKFTQLVIFILW